jgi:hypothetical protein
VEVFDDSFALQQREVVIHNSSCALAEAVDLSVGDLRLGPALCEFLFGVNGRQFADARLVARRCGDVPVSKSLGEIVVGGLSVDYFVDAEGDSIRFPGWLGILHSLLLRYWVKDCFSAA